MKIWVDINLFDMFFDDLYALFDDYEMHDKFFPENHGIDFFKAGNVEVLKSKNTKDKFNFQKNEYYQFANKDELVLDIKKKYEENYQKSYIDNIMNDE